jgi:uncharacterized protein YciI
MSAVVYCQDSDKARSERERSYDAHISYLGAIKDRIRFAGPLATTDGARGQGDESLFGSLFVMDEPPSVAHALMRADPYVQSGVWQSVSVFQAVESFGRWLSAGVPQTAGRLYASLARDGDADLVAREAALFGARLRPRADVVPATSWSAAAIFTATSLPEARAMVIQDSAEEDRGIHVWAVPISVGTWIRTIRST